MTKEELRERFAKIYRNRILNETKYVRIDAWLGSRYNHIFTDNRGRKVELPKDMIDNENGTKFIVDINKFRMLGWKPEYGFMHVKLEVACSARYFLLNEIGEPFCKYGGRPPEGVVPCHGEDGKIEPRFVEFDILEDGKVTGWPCPTHYDQFIKHGDFFFTMDDRKWIDEQLSNPNGDIDIKSIPYKCKIEIYGYGGNNVLDRKEFTDVQSATEYMMEWSPKPEVKSILKINGCWYTPFYREEDESGEHIIADIPEVMAREKYDYIRRYVIPDFLEKETEEMEALGKSSNLGNDSDNYDESEEEDNGLPF